MFVYKKRVWTKQCIFVRGKIHQIIVSVREQLVRSGQVSVTRGTRGNYQFSDRRRGQTLDTEQPGTVITITG